MVWNFLKAIFQRNGAKEIKTPFQIKVIGVEPEHLIEISGPNGTFYVAEIGSRPELLGGMFYGDRNIQFCFYTELKKFSDGTFKVDVYTATTERLKGNTPRIDRSYLPKVMENIEFFLFTRDYNFPEQPSKPSFTVSEVIFNWGISFLYTSFDT